MADKWSSRLLLACVAVLLALPASAQELRGLIGGVVTDNTGAVLPGAAVIAESPAIIRPRTTASGSDGSYQIPALPPGLYTLTFELQGFKTLKREQVRVGLNTTVTINAQLELAALEETVVITGESPVVDIKSTNIGTNFSKELLQDIPNARDIWAAMSQAPGFQMTGYDVGGSHTGTQTGYVTYGLAGQNKTLLEGINVTEGTDANAGYFDFGSFEEFQLGGAGNMGEQAGPGALLNLTIKSGGDQLAAQVYYDYENDSTISDNVPGGFKSPGGTSGGFKAPTIRDPATGELMGLQRGNPITRQYDFNVGGGGPIRRGKAWFYAAYRDNNQFKTILGLPGEDAQSQLKNYTVKLTYQLSTNNQVIYFFNQRTKFQPLRNLSLARPVESAWWQSSKNRPQKLEWTSVLSNDLFLDLQYSHWGNFFPLFPTETQAASVEGVPVGRLELTTNQASGAWSYYHDRTTLKPQLSGSLSYFQDDWGGTHNFKFGFEAYRERRKFLRFQPGNIYYRDRNGVPAEVDLYNTPNEGINDANHLGIYLQDGWSLTRKLTLNLGARYDRYSLGWPAQSFTPEQADFFPPVTTPETTVAEFNSLSPRAGFAWDVTGKGKTVVKGFYGRYYFNPSTGISDNENPVGQAAIRFQMNDLNGNGLLDGPAELGRELRTLGGAGFVRVDRGLEHAYGQEVSTHLEQEVAEGLSVRGSYVYKNTRNGWDEVDLARVNAYTLPFSFVDPGPDDVSGTADDQTLALVDRPADTPSDRVFTNPGLVAGVPDDKGDYHTVEFAIHRRFRNRWLLLTSFEHTWAKDFRGTGSSNSTLGIVRQGTDFLWEPNRRRFSRQDTTFWNYKLVGRYVFPYDIGLSASYKLQSGYDWARTISVRLPGAGSETIHAEPVDSNRSDNVHIFDVRVEKSLAFPGRWGRVTGMIDVFNAFNANPITNFRVISGSRFQEVIALLDPRIVRFGVRYEF